MKYIIWIKYLERKLPKSQIIERKRQKSSFENIENTRGSLFVTVATRSSGTSFRKFPSPQNTVFEENIDEETGDNNNEYNKYSFFNNAQLLDLFSFSNMLIIFFFSYLGF